MCFFICYYFTFQVINKEIDGKITGISKLEDEAKSFSKFITSGECARIKAKLTQVKRYWEELRDHAQRLEGTITGNVSAQQKYEESLKQVDNVKFNGLFAAVCRITLSFPKIEYKRHIIVGWTRIFEQSFKIIARSLYINLCFEKKAQGGTKLYTCSINCAVFWKTKVILLHIAVINHTYVSYKHFL